MNIRIGYYPILDMLLAFRQIYSYERFKPFNALFEAMSSKISDIEKDFIYSVGEETRGWLHAISNMLVLTLEGKISPEEALLTICKNPVLLFDCEGKDRIQSEIGLTIKNLWLNYFSNETAKNNKLIYEKVFEISNQVEEKGITSYLVDTASGRIKLAAENELVMLIKPEHKVLVSEMENVLIMPSIYASRELTFWHNNNDYIFYVSTENTRVPGIEPSDMLMLKTLALNDKTRLKMLRHLAHSSSSTADIAQILDVNSSTASRHFKVFKDAGFVDIFSQEGNSIYYNINMEEIKKAFHEILNYISGRE